MATTFSEGKTGLDEISAEIRESGSLLAIARANPTTVKSRLDALATSRAAMLADIDAAAAANPANTALANLKAEKDLLVAEFQAKRAEAVALETAVAGA